VSLLEKDHLECPACGSENPKDMERCEICGSLLNITTEEKKVLDTLKSIPDVGRKRAEKIIEGGLSEVSDLEKNGKDDFASITGIGSATAEKIVEFIDERKDDDGRLKLCDDCGSLIGQSTEICPECGYEFVAEKKVVGSEEGSEEGVEDESSSADACTVCGTSLDAEQEICPVCGNSLTADEKKIEEDMEAEAPEYEEEETRGCEVCGTPLDEGTTVCPVCQAEQSSSGSIYGTEEELAETEVKGVEEELEVEDEEVEDELVGTEVEGVEEELEGEEELEETEEEEGEEDSEEETAWEIYEAYPGEMEEDIDHIKSVLDSVDKDPIDTGHIEEGLDQVLTLRENGEHEEAMDLILDLILELDDIIELHECLSDIEDLRSTVSRTEGSLQLIKRLEDIRYKCREGDYTSALDIAESLEQMDVGEREEDPDEVFKNRLKRVRINLRTARSTNFELVYIKDKVKTALQTQKSGDIEEGLIILNRGLTRLQKILVLSSMFEAAKVEIRRIRKLGEDTTDFSLQLKEIKDTADEGKLLKAIKEINGFLETLHTERRELEESSPN